MDFQKIIDTKMKNMEMSSNKRKSMSVEALNNADRTPLSIEEVKKKYRSVSSLSAADSENTAAEDRPQLNEDIDVKLIRNKDRTEDDSDPVGERAIIFNRQGGILGSQG